MSAPYLWLLLHPLSEMHEEVQMTETTIQASFAVCGSFTASRHPPMQMQAWVAALRKTVGRSGPEAQWAIPVQPKLSGASRRSSCHSNHLYEKINNELFLCELTYLFNLNKIISTISFNNVVTNEAQTFI